MVQPFQDAWGWVTGLFDARGQNEDLKAQNAALQQRVLALSDQSAEIARLRSELKVDDAVPGGYTPVNASIIGRSPTMRQIFDLADDVKDTDSTVLICGESGRNYKRSTTFIAVQFFES